MREPASLANHICFGVFEVDLRTGELRKQGLKLKLQIQPFRILAMLLERPGELVTREEIREKLWPADTFIDFEHSVNSSIKKLREVLCDDAEKPRYIETLPRRGYRFIAPAEPVAPVSPPAEAVAPVYDRRPEHAAPRAALQRRFALVAGAFVTIVAALFALNIVGLRDRVVRGVGAVREPPLPRIESIAVLPLENLSHNPEQEYFADGMTDELIATLAKIGSLRVISRTSVMRYKGTKKPLPEIARELNVDGIVEGTVLRAGNRVRITAQLLQAPTDRHLWAESYESELSDVLLLQGEVARAIADAIRINVTPQEQARLTCTRAVNPEAHEAYLKGRFLLTRRVLSRGRTQLQQTLDTAHGYFESALKKDPNYAPGYVGISLAWRMRGEFLPPREVFPKAKAAALKALELDNTLADAHEALAQINFYYEWDWAAAEREFRRAIELDPNSGELRVAYMALLHVMRRPQEAKAQIERALELDPLNPRVQFWFCLHLMFSRQYDAAIAQAREMLKLEPDVREPHVFLQSAFRAKGQLQEWFAEGKKSYADDPEIIEALDRGYARGGYREAARLAAETLARRGTCNAVLYADAGDYNRAFECAEKGYAKREPAMVFGGVAPDVDPLRSDPRFQDLMRRMNLPP